MKVENKASQQTPDSNDKKSSCNKSFPSLATCWGILLLIMLLRIYFSTVLEKQITNLTAETQMLKKKNEELETEKKNLTEKIQQMTTSWNELNVSRAQWSIDAYCPKENNNRKCNACQKGWQHAESSCYATADVNRSEWKTWKEARENCRGKISDLAVVINEEEKKTVSEKSWKNNENKGYWIGLRVEDGKWKWLDGRNLTSSSWIDQPPSVGHCAISVQDQGFKSVSCNEKNRWICKKKALSV
ncbi:C-type lectin domain family 4 member G [Oreochromis niloticus]|uniref:C-type lectin domain family 4 member G n=1 Tax=Oreochromis niloticus TaxID=8128 RepID=UPI000905A962|nr:C-type lectin domain family 4 member G [Oreochromis niloticus]